MLNEDLFFHSISESTISQGSSIQKENIENSIVKNCRSLVNLFRKPNFVSFSFGSILIICGIIVLSLNCENHNPPKATKLNIIVLFFPILGIVAGLMFLVLGLSLTESEADDDNEDENESDLKNVYVVPVRKIENLSLQTELDKSDKMTRAKKSQDPGIIIHVTQPSPNGSPISSRSGSGNSSIIDKQRKDSTAMLGVKGCELADVNDDDVSGFYKHHIRRKSISNWSNHNVNITDE